jgi:hypothetical protein
MQVLALFYFSAAAPAPFVGHEILEESAVIAAAERHASRYQWRVLITENRKRRHLKHVGAWSEPEL